MMKRLLEEDGMMKRLLGRLMCWLDFHHYKLKWDDSLAPFVCQKCGKEIDPRWGA